MHKLGIIWRDLGIVGRAVWPNLTLFAALLLSATLLLWWSKSYPEAHFLEVLVNAFHMTHLEAVSPGKGALPAVFIFVLPVLTIIILGEGALRVAGVYLQRRQHREEWELMVAKTFAGHTVICGLGELGRTICIHMLEKNPLAQIVLVDVVGDLLIDLGLDEIQHSNVSHVRGDMTAQATLEAANCQAAGLMVMSSGDDGHNLEAGGKARGINPQAQIWIRLHRSQVSKLLCPTEKTHFFSPYKSEAEKLVADLDGQGRIPATPTVICGLGELGRAVCNCLLERNPLTPLVLVDVRKNLLADLGFDQSHYPHVSHKWGDMTSKATLEGADCGTAQLIVLTSGDDGHNLEAGVKAREINPQAKIWIRLHRSQVAKLICPTDNVHFFSPYERAADTLVAAMNTDAS
ncbi:MAG: hypothetical protein A2Z73_05390 [Deltaproteobacteria bacterium RBG_13_60_28]|nr:MAG: hypothetical protein A2Z73_05390 [Deltaproteobacteria bacterium RBG_13_60_28]